LTISDKYATGAAIGLLFLVLINNSVVMLVVAILGLLAGAFVVRRGEAKRVAYVAAIAFAIAFGFAVYGLLTA
jgi:F0F1-type ATP synthase assembly protein I